MKTSGDIEIHAVTVSSMGGLQILQNFLNFYSDVKIILWVRSNNQIQSIDIPKNVSIRIYDNINFFKGSCWQRVIIYMNGLSIVRPRNSITILFIQNILYLSKNSALNLRGLIKKFVFKISYATLNHQDVAIVQTKYVRDQILQYSTFSKNIQVLGALHPVNVFHVTKMIGATDNCKYINGFIYPTAPALHKNNESLVTIWNELSARYPHLPTLYITINKYDLLSGLHEKIFPKVKFLGALEQRRLFEELKNKAVFFVSTHETLGLPILEATAMHQPTIILDADYSREYPNITFRIQELNAAEIVTMLNKLILDGLLLLAPFETNLLDGK
jgi:glycosyltransferase involved in cell wall biosynthesis